MNDRSKKLFRLKSNFHTRRAYITAKLGTLVPSQIRALRIKSDMPRQADLAQASEMLQSRISLIETPGAANVTLDTLSRIAAAFKVGLIVKFVPFSEMLAWENNFSQDQFDVVKIDKDTAFLSPTPFVQTIELVLTAPYQWEPSGLTHGQNAFSPEIVRTYCNPTVLWDATTETVAQYSHVN